MRVIIGNKLFDADHKHTGSCSNSHFKFAPMPAATFLVRSSEHLIIEVRFNDQDDNSLGVENGVPALDNRNNQDHFGGGTPTIAPAGESLVLGNLFNLKQDGNGDPSRSPWWENPHRILALNADTRVIGFEDQGKLLH